MITTDVDTASESTSELSTLDLKLETVVIPVADVDRSKSFYERLGWRPDADFSFDNGVGVVQLTPPGSGAILHDPDGNAWLMREVTTRLPNGWTRTRPRTRRRGTSRTRCGARRSRTADTKPG